MYQQSREIMKKLINKVLRKEEVVEDPPSRITTDTIEQHREQILAGGRKFKYPVQYVKHRLVINAILISLASVLLAIGVGWWLLYPQQNTSEIMYRVTTVIPVPVAVVDGQFVPYSDYLMSYRSSEYFAKKYQQLDDKTDDGKRQLDYFKQQSLREAIANAYAMKLSKNLGVKVTDADVDASIKQQREQVSGEVTQQSYDASTQDYLGLSPIESRRKIYNGLLRQRVSFVMDKDASSNINKVKQLVNADPKRDFKALASSVVTNGKKVVYGTSGWVPKTNLDGGLAMAASKMTKSKVSDILMSTKGDGYFIIRLLDSKDGQVNYEYIQAPLTAFNDALNKVYADGKVQKFISVSDVAK